MKFAYDFVLFLDNYFPAIQNYYSILNADDTDQILGADMNLTKSKNGKIFGTVTGIRRNNIYRPLIKMISGANLTQDSKFKVMYSSTF